MRICLVKLRRKIRSNLFILISLTININILIKLNRVNIVKLSKEVRLNLFFVFLRDY